MQPSGKRQRCIEILDVRFTSGCRRPLQTRLRNGACEASRMRRGSSRCCGWHDLSQQRLGIGVIGAARGREGFQQLVFNRRDTRAIQTRNPAATACRGKRHGAESMTGFESGLRGADSKSTDEVSPRHVEFWKSAPPQAHRPNGKLFRWRRAFCESRHSLPFVEICWHHASRISKPLA